MWTKSVVRCLLSVDLKKYDKQKILHRKSSYCVPGDIVVRGTAVGAGYGYYHGGSPRRGGTFCRVALECYHHQHHYDWTRHRDGTHTIGRHSSCEKRTSAVGNIIPELYAAEYYDKHSSLWTASSHQPDAASVRSARVGARHLGRLLLYCHVLLDTIYAVHVIQADARRSRQYVLFHVDNDRM